MSGFGTGARFKGNNTITPGPGAYDPSAEIGFKVDPTSGFQGNDRFIEDNKSGGTHRSTDISPREKKPHKDSRSYAWTAQRIKELEREVEVLKAQNKEKDRLLQQQGSEKAEKAALKEALQKAEEFAQDVKEKSEADVEQLKSQLLIANEKRSKLEKELMDSEGRCLGKDQEFKVLESEMVKFKEEMTSQTKRMRSFSSEIDSLQAQLKASQEENAKKKTEIAKITDEKQALTVELATKQSHFDASLSEARNDLEMQKSSHVEDVNSLKMQVDAARQEVSLRASMIEELEKKVEKFKGRLDSSREQEARLREGKKELEQDKSQQQTEISSLGSKLEEVEAQLTTKNGELESRTEDVAKLQKLVETSEQASQIAADRALELEKELTSKLNEVSELRETCTELKGSVREKESTIAELKAQNDAADASAKENAAITQDLEERIVKTAKNLEEKTHALDEMQATLTAKANELNELKCAQAEVSGKEKTANELCETQQSHILQLKEHLQCAQDELNNKVAGFERHTVTLNLKVSEAENKISALEKDLEAKEEAKVATEAKLKEATGELAEKVAILTKMETCHSELSEKSKQVEESLLSQLENIKSQHESQMETVKAEASTGLAMKKEMDDMKASLRKAQNQEQKLQTELSSVKKELEDIGKHNQQVEELQAALEVAQKRVTKAESAAHRFKSEVKRGEAVKAEMSRLIEENEVLLRRTQELDADVKGMLTTNTSVLGHHNPKQKIQYHLKLKQDFEELKGECTSLLQEKFRLEQCIRYLSSVGSLEAFPSYAEPVRACQVVVPKSLAGNVATLTPSSRNQMKWAGRGKAAKMSDLSPYQPRENMEQAIEHIKLKTVKEVEGFIENEKEMDFVDGGLVSTQGEEGSPGTPSGSQESPRASSGSDGVDAKIQARIIAKINSIVEPRPKRKADTQQEEVF